ncbi:unnamed protein product [Paramecium sonneborni]|uniref:Uncharacterized protein n=1 Tax=Paramecium sonneborni TaxID=65129 RepID=A0A8S1RQM7_9CILI|nr:unnamed protein product [Paramecium sonneborni]
MINVMNNSHIAQLIQEMDVRLFSEYNCDSSLRHMAIIITNWEYMYALMAIHVKSIITDVGCQVILKLYINNSKGCKQRTFCHDVTIQESLYIY